MNGFGHPIAFNDRSKLNSASLSGFPLLSPFSDRSISPFSFSQFFSCRCVAEFDILVTTMSVRDFVKVATCFGQNWQRMRPSFQAAYDLTKPHVWSELPAYTPAWGMIFQRHLNPLLCFAFLCAILLTEQNEASYVIKFLIVRVRLGSASPFWR